jgi:hypothetical protein
VETRGISSESSCDNKVGFYRQDRPVIIEVGFRSGSSYNDVDRPCR